jgi:putative sigma-54 modulation protein
MKILSTGINLKLTESMKSYIEDKIGILSRYFKGQDEVLKAEIDVRMDTHHQKGDVYMISIRFVAKGKEFYTKERHETFYGAIDIAQEELEKQMQRYKEELKDNLGQETIRKM